MQRNLAAALALLAAALSPATAGAQPLSIVPVAAPAINCVFAASCSVTVNDVASPLLRGGFLQSRTYQAEPGSPAAGKWVYEYRVNLTRATRGSMVTALTVDFGPVEGGLDYNGDRTPDEVFVVVSGGLGAVAPTAAVRRGRMVTFRFDRPVNSGATSFFFGMVSSGEPRSMRVRVVSNMNPSIFVQGSVPRAGRAEAEGPTETSGPMAAEDCLPYDRTHLRISDEGAAGWLLTDGRSRMLMLDSQADAERALAVARAHTHHCFIGRDNHRPDRVRYIVHYWRGNPGATATAGDDCLGYDPATVGVFDRGATGWRLEDGPHALVLFDNQADANRGLVVARAFSNLCFIGRGNSRPNREDFIVQYWR